MWVLIVVFELVAFPVVVESREECQELGQASSAHWTLTGQKAHAVCMRTTEV